MLLPALCGVRLLSVRRRVFYPFIEPRNHFPQRVLGGFTGKVSVGFIWKLDIADDTAISILLVHGMADDNSVTFPIQRERIYQAIKGNGGIVGHVQVAY